MLIERPPQWYRALFPGALFRLQSAPGEGKRVFLTFDDGPIPEVTPMVLDILDNFKAKATFFMVGQNIERYPSLLRDIISRGHSVGSHTLHHLKGVGVSTEEYVADARKAAQLTGTKLFRPPHGVLRGRQFKTLSQEFTIVMYDLVTRDYSKHLSPQDVVKNVKRFTRDGSIIVFHDSLKSLPRLKEALPESLKWLTEQGYRFDLLK